MYWTKPQAGLLWGLYATLSEFAVARPTIFRRGPRSIQDFIYPRRYLSAFERKDPMHRPSNACCKLVFQRFTTSLDLACALGRAKAWLELGAALSPPHMQDKLYQVCRHRLLHIWSVSSHGQRR